MTFNILTGLVSGSSKKNKTSASFWSAIGTLQNSAYAAKVVGDRLGHILKRDVAIRDAVKVLRQARHNITKYGATESAMSIFNQGNELSNSLNIQIPTVTKNNARQVGNLCAKRITAKIDETVQYTRQYANSVTNELAKLINKTHTLSKAQKQILSTLYNKVSNDIKYINPRVFGKSVVCGYTRPIFMERVNALQHIVDNLYRCNNVTQAKKLFAKQFRNLHWFLTDDGEVIEATPEEVAEQSPDEEEVMVPATDPDTGDPIEGEDETEEEIVEAPAETEDPEEEETPAAAPQEQPMAVFGWTPKTIKTSASALYKLSGYVNKLSKTYSNVVASRKKLNSSVESYKSSVEKTTVFNSIDSCRRYTNFVGSLLINYNEAVNELVNQTVSMYGILKDSQAFAASRHAASVNSITAKYPWGVKRKGYFNEDDIPEGDAEGEEDVGDSELAGDMEDDTEGPTKAKEPIEETSDMFYYNDDIPEGDAEGEEDASDTELAGDLEDDVEGPTESDDPVEDADGPGPTVEDIWTDTFDNYFNEDETETAEETADEGDEENEEEEVEEEAEEEEGDEPSEGDEDPSGEDDEESEDDEEAATESLWSYFDEDTDTLPESDAEGEVDESDTELAGDLEDDVEGPTESDEPDEDGDSQADDTDVPDSDDQGQVDDPANEEASTVDWYNEDDDIPEGDAEGEVDESETELAGDLEDDVEGPTEADDPDEDAAGPGPTVSDLWFNENEDTETDTDSEVSEDSEGDSDGVEEDSEVEDTEGDEEADGDEVEESDVDEDEGIIEDFWRNQDEDGDDPADDGEVESPPVEDDNTEADEASDDVADEVDPDGDAPADGDDSVGGDDPVESGDEPELVENDTSDMWYNENEDAGIEPGTNLDTEPDSVDYDGDEEVEDGDSEAAADEDDDVEEETAEDETESELNDWYDEDDDMVVGPDTPDDFPTEEPDHPDGVDPNGDVDIPDAQTEPYIQPESTPPEDVPDTSIEDIYFE